ncbi:putative signal peptide protein [Puccinia sorghi]|uniref:Putative signal peptide protein n=1 Tax=Puccinia sorghi TaxID=27349 RepID=A0A0L6VB63_9BASI|nr:putative signal peptide protein [Puccinia sorghi]
MRRHPKVQAGKGWWATGPISSCSVMKVDAACVTWTTPSWTNTLSTCVALLNFL